MARIKKIEKDLLDLENDLKKEIYNKGVVNSSVLLGCKQSYLSSWLNGKRNLSYNKIIEIAKKLKL